MIMSLLYINSNYKFIYCFHDYFCMNPSLFSIENLQMKFQIRNALYSSRNLCYLYINENEMNKY